ncbi:hypothetical protein X566_19085 [Afipia sp. P52-10]|uniref:hypothetical protein n=1 Tax=Afipia sp. P52-10 TaxID=1429916 RepID=UPI0003DF319C|nr:hypothetical protein [Afipia sp. P52-10]ETR75872.1 hypothetical protein X566_19085 [Afipia sp. P52-10]
MLNLLHYRADQIVSSAATRIVLSLVYAAVVFVAYRWYLHHNWKIYGFEFFPPSAITFAAVAVLISLQAAVLPHYIDRASGLFVSLVYVLVIVPTLVVTALLTEYSFSQHAPSLLAMTAGFCLCCHIARSGPQPTGKQISSVPLESLIAVFFSIATVVLFYQHHAILSWAPPDAPYEQRALGRASGAVLAYTRTYYLNVACPGLFAFGLLKRNYLYLAAALGGFVLNYLIDAQRTALCMPVVMTILFLALCSNWRPLRSNSLLILLSATGLAASYLLYQHLLLYGQSQFIILRTIGLPGLALSSYAETFSGERLTWWSHVRGISMFVPKPIELLSDPNWPQLGLIVGRHMIGYENFNYNAHFFASDGVAAAGWMGILAVSVVFAAWLKLLDYCSSGWDIRLVILLMSPLTMVVLNAPLFTTLASFGGLFWPITLYVFSENRFRSLWPRLRPHRS